MFLAVVSADVVIYEKLPNDHCENRRELGAQASSCEPHLSFVCTQTAPTLPHPTPPLLDRLRENPSNMWYSRCTCLVAPCENSKQKYLHMFV